MTGQRRGEIVVAIIGSSWIVRPHAHALHTLNHLGKLPVGIRIRWIYGRRPEKMLALADELEIERSSTDWRQLIEDPEVDIVLNAGAHPLHAPVSIAAIEAGKHVLCEKPLAATTEEARMMREASEKASVLAVCGFNYRFVPAIRLLKEELAGGRLGDIRHYRGLYLQDWLSNNPDWPGLSGGSAVRDFSHLFDMLRYLAGDPASVVGWASSVLSDADDAFLGGFVMADGTASLEASSCATGWKARHRVEVNGTKGSAWWDMEEFNKLHIMFVEDQREGLGGFRDVLVTEPSHPFMSDWWEAGSVIGWQSTFVHEWRAFLESILTGGPLDPNLATFGDGVSANELGDAVLEAARTGTRLRLSPA